MIRIVIPCYKSISTIEQCIQSVLQSGINDSYEIVVVDNGRNEGLREVLAQYPVHIMYGNVNGNAAAARNRGVLGFEGEIIVFVDADVILQPDALSLLIEPLQNGYADATVGNYSTNIEQLTFPQSYKQLYIHQVYSRRNGYITNQFWTAVGAVKTSVFHSVGGFSSHFSGACGEDMELGQRLSRSRYRIFAVPEAQGKHLKSYSVQSLVRNDLKKGSNCVYLSMLNKSALSSNRHASLYDKMAVVYAYAMLGVHVLPILSIVSQQSYVIAFILVMVSYLTARIDLLQTYRKPGMGFGLRCMLLQYGLDIVKGLCIACGVMEYFAEKYSHTAQPAEKYTV